MIKISNDPNGATIDAFCRIVLRYGLGNYGKGRFSIKGLDSATEERKLERTDMEVSESGGPAMKIERRMTKTERTEFIVEGEGSSDEEEEIKTTRITRRVRRARRG
mmetsp:Transcript_17750/g.32054  ORF Transcript_17750/g.32054 Transcript_17750/m.32054 type:complete len:106 (-) Transcript_17750:35-352(-)